MGPGGEPGQSPALFRSAETAQALAELCRSYDLILIDGPPLLASAGSAVLHCLQGDLANAGEVIECARAHFREVKFRGLALPGDRLTKNLFEEARMPAQMLLH